MVATSDGGYALAGVDLLVKTDAAGNMEWNKTYSIGAPSLIQTDDGGYAMAGGTILIKTDAMGNMEWNHTDENARFYFLVQTSDGKYVVVGRTYDFSHGLGNFFLAKTDESGSIEWKRTYGKTDFTERFSSLVATSDGGYLLAGEIFKPSEYDSERDAWLVKTNSTGHIEWIQTYERKYVDKATAVVEASDGGYVIAGSSGGASGIPPPYENYKMSYSIPSDLWLFKIDESGNKEWEQTYGEGGWDSAYALVEASDGGYAIAGSLDGDCWLVKTDEFGNMEWNRTYDGESFSSLVQASDGGYVLAGEKDSPDGEDSDFWLMKTDEFGVSPDLIPEPLDTNVIAIAVAAVTAVIATAILVYYTKRRKS